MNPPDGASHHHSLPRADHAHLQEGKSPKDVQKVQEVQEVQEVQTSSDRAPLERWQRVHQSIC